MAQGGNYASINSVAVNAVNGSSTNNEFVITLGFTIVYGGQSVTILAQGKNPGTAGSETLTMWTSGDSTRVSVGYTIGASPGGLMQGAIPNAGAAPMLNLDSPAYLQTLFGTPTDTIPTLVTDYLPSGSGWDGMDGATGSLSYLNVFAVPGYQLVLGVPIITTSNGSNVGSLQQGSQTNPFPYHDQYVQLANSLINEGLGNAWLRLGYEFDNTGNAWGTGNDTKQEGYFAAYFSNIVNTMRSVSGAHFKFVWNPDAFAFDGGAEDTVYPGYNVAAAFPVDPSVVDFIGIDLYDYAPASGYTPSQEWSWIEPQLTSTTPGALGAEPFAAQYGKPLAFPEWGVAASEVGLNGMGDDPNYINQMYCVMSSSSNNVAWESYSNTSYTNWNTQITGGSFPHSLAAFQSDFGTAGNPYNCSG